MLTGMQSVLSCLYVGFYHAASYGRAPSEQAQGGMMKGEGKFEICINADNRRAATSLAIT